MIRCNYCRTSLIGETKIPLDEQSDYPERFCSEECRKERIYDMIERAKTYDILADQNQQENPWVLDFRKDAFEIRKRARRLLDE